MRPFLTIHHLKKGEYLIFVMSRICIRSSSRWETIKSRSCLNLTSPQPVKSDTLYKRATILSTKSSMYIQNLNITQFNIQGTQIEWPHNAFLTFVSFSFDWKYKFACNDKWQKDNHNLDEFLSILTDQFGVTQWTSSDRKCIQHVLDTTRSSQKLFAVGTLVGHHFETVDTAWNAHTTIQLKDA